MDEHVYCQNRFQIHKTGILKTVNSISRQLEQIPKYYANLHKMSELKQSFSFSVRTGTNSHLVRLILNLF